MGGQTYNLKQKVKMNLFILLEETNIVLKIIGGILMCGLFIVFYIGMVKVMSWITGWNIGYKGKPIASPNDIGGLFKKKNKENDTIYPLKPGGKDGFGRTVPTRNEYTIERLVSSIRGLDELEGSKRSLIKIVIRHEISTLFSSGQMSEEEYNLLMSMFPPY